MKPSSKALLLGVSLFLCFLISYQLTVWSIKHLAARQDSDGQTVLAVESGRKKLKKAAEKDSADHAAYKMIAGNYVGKAWVATARLPRHTCPSSKCGMVGKLYYREAVRVIVHKAGWARITELYDASCVNGSSEYVDSGNDRCDSRNGIVDGKFAEWVLSSSLSATRPADPEASAKGVYKLVAGSDDYLFHKQAFLEAAQSLFHRNKCTERDFLNWGGWVKSTRRGSNWYFMACKNSTQKYYLNVATGAIE